MFEFNAESGKEEPVDLWGKEKPVNATGDTAEHAENYCIGSRAGSNEQGDEEVILT